MMLPPLYFHFVRKRTNRHIPIVTTFRAILQTNQLRHKLSDADVANIPAFITKKWGIAFPYKKQHGFLEAYTNYK